MSQNRARSSSEPPPSARFSPTETLGSLTKTLWNMSGFGGSSSPEQTSKNTKNSPTIPEQSEDNLSKEQIEDKNLVDKDKALENKQAETLQPAKLVKPNRPTKRRLKAPISVDTQNGVSQESKSAPLQNSMTLGELVSPVDSNCVCKTVIDSIDPRFCKLCSGFLVPVAKLGSDTRKTKEELEKAKQLVDTLTVRSEQAEELVNSLRTQTDALAIEISKKEGEMLALRRDLDAMGEKLVDEIEKRAEIQHSKDAVQEELEELTRSLFEEANTMVASEAKQRHKFEQEEMILKKQLEQARLQLQMEQSQLRELKLRMESLTFENQTLKKSTLTTKPNLTLPTSPSIELNEEKSIDPILFEQFQDFLDIAPKTRLNKLHTIAFLKHALEDDVSPCLRFGKMNGKKFIDSIIENVCFVEEMSASQILELEARDENLPLATTLSKKGSKDVLKEDEEVEEEKEGKVSKAGASVFSRISSALNSAIHQSMNSLELGPGCSTCGNSTEPYKYQFKITDVTSDTWYPICTRCRLRIVTVCDFYNFIRHVRQGLYSSRKRQDLYFELLKLKREMFYSRLGVERQVNHQFMSPTEAIKPNDLYVQTTMMADALLSGKSSPSTLQSP